MCSASTTIEQIPLCSIKNSLFSMQSHINVYDDISAGCDRGRCVPLIQSDSLSLLFTNSQHAIICEFFNSFPFSVFNNTTFFINIIFPTNYISRGFLLNPSFQLTKWIQPQTFLLYISMVKGTLSTLRLSFNNLPSLNWQRKFKRTQL